MFKQCYTKILCNTIFSGTEVCLSREPDKFFELSASYVFLRNFSGRGTDINCQQLAQYNKLSPKSLLN